MNIMMNIKRFHPGVYIKDTLEVLEMTSKEFSARTGISERTLSAIINGKGDITFDVAYKLASFFDDSVNFWTNLQNDYNMYILEETKKQEIKEEGKLVKKLKPYLIKEKYISDNDSEEDIVKKCRSLAGVNSLLCLNVKDAFISFKEHSSDSADKTFYQNFWIALALNEARKKKPDPFNKKLLKSFIPEIRSMTTEDPEIFYPKLEEIFTKCGISFVLLPYLSKSYIYGATKWISKDNVMLAISNRGEKADLFWFTLFHELSHVLMEHKRETLFNMHGNDDALANEMAADLLIPQSDWLEFLKNNNFTEDAIRNFAKKEGIHPCIVLGRLHKEKNSTVPYGLFDNIFGLSYQIKNSL